MAVEIKKINGVYMGSQEIASTRFASDANLVGYWRMEGNSLDETANDLDGTDTAITYGTAYGKFNQGATFGGSSKIVLPDVAGLNPASISVSFWLKSTQASDYIHIVSNCLVGGSNYYGYYVGMMTDNIRFQLFYGDTTSSPLDGTRVINDGVWHYITATFDGTTQKLFVDGTLDNSRASAAISYGGAAAPGFGAYIAGDSNKYSGSLDDVAIFSRALTSDEIYSLYKTGVKKLNGQVNLNPELESTSLRGDANLVEYLRLEGNSTATVGSNGTDTDMTYGATYGKFGQGGLFNGTSSKIVTGNCNIGTRFTVSIWIKADGNQILYSRVIENDYANGGFAISAKSTTTWDAGVNGTTLTTFPPIKSGVWNHLALVYNGASITLYSDGVPYSVASTTDPTKTNIPLYIGEYVGGGNYYFKGSMDDVAIFSRALTAQEISNLYNTNIKKYNGVSNV